MKTIKKILILWLLGLTASFGAADVGRFSMVNGEVFVERGAQKVSASVGMEVAVGDRVVTGASARAQLLFADETVITLGRSSKFMVEDYLFDEAAGKAKSHFAALEGGFRSVTGKIGKIAPDQFQLKTKTATMGIRGTKFIGSIGEQGDTFACTEGAITVANNQGGEPVEVPAGRMVMAAADGAPMNVRAYTPEDLQELEKDIGIGGEGEEEGSPQEEQSEESPSDESTQGQEGEPEGQDPEPSLADELEEAFVEETDGFEGGSETAGVDLDALGDQADGVSEEVAQQLASETSQTPDIAVEFAVYNPSFASVSTGTQNENLPPAAPAIDDAAYRLRSNIAQDIAVASSAVLGDQLGTGFVVGSDTVAVEYYRIDGENWGYWQDEGVSVEADRLKTQVWVSGIQTLSSEVSQLMMNQAKHTYNGKALGAVHHIPGFAEGTADAILMNGNNQVQLNIDFGSLNPVSGYIRFETELGAQWNANLGAGGSLSSIGYSHNAPTGTVSSVYGGQGGITGGLVQGQFYGTGASGTGGTFNLQSGQGTATGVFSGNR